MIFIFGFAFYPSFLKQIHLKKIHWYLLCVYTYNQLQKTTGKFIEKRWEDCVKLSDKQLYRECHANLRNSEAELSGASSSRVCLWYIAYTVCTQSCKIYCTLVLILFLIDFYWYYLNKVRFCIKTNENILIS